MGLLFPRSAGKSKNLRGASYALPFISAILGCRGLCGLFQARVRGSYIICQTPCKMKTPSWVGIGEANIPFPRAHSASPQRTANPQGMATFTPVHMYILGPWMGGQETSPSCTPHDACGTLTLRPKGRFLESHPQMPWGGRTRS